MTPPSPRGAASAWASSPWCWCCCGWPAIHRPGRPGRGRHPVRQVQETAPAGFQWRMPYPIQNHEMVNVSQLRTFEVGFRGGSRNKVLPEALMLTTDENIVDMQFVVQYRLRADGAPDYLFKMRDPDESVRQAAETAMREIVGKADGLRAL
ncbi:hypothetical protein AL462_000015 [Bordetella parapertussis]|nr:hypothetical protein AL462_000015 [Bordetella parapertussis]